MQAKLVSRDTPHSAYRQGVIVSLTCQRCSYVGYTHPEAYLPCVGLEGSEGRQGCLEVACGAEGWRARPMRFRTQSKVVP